MRLRPFFSYYGSKWRLAPKYSKPKFDTIIEPFAGSASYSLLYPKRKVKLIDLDDNICILWEYLINVKEKEIRALPLLERNDPMKRSKIKKQLGSSIHHTSLEASIIECQTRKLTINYSGIGAKVEMDNQLFVKMEQLNGYHFQTSNQLGELQKSLKN